MTYRPPQWRVGYAVAPVLLLTLATTLFLALQGGTLWAAALAGGMIAGFFISVAWTLRHFAPNASAALVGAAVVPLGLLWLVTPGTGIGGLGAAGAVFAIWFGVYDLGVTGRANRAVESAVATIAGHGDVRALIVYHSTQGGFQPRVLRAFAAGLASRGWRVDMTTASGATPTDLSPHDLLILGAPSYNWQPARPTLAYLERLGDLNGKAVILLVSGGGMTQRAMKILFERVVRARGRIVNAIELWTTRANTPQYGTSDPAEIMRRAALRVATPRSPGGFPAPSVSGPSGHEPWDVA